MLLVDTNVSTVGASNPDRKSTSKIYNDLHIVVDFRIVVPEKNRFEKEKATRSLRIQTIPRLIVGGMPGRMHDD